MIYFVFFLSLFYSFSASSNFKRDNQQGELCGTSFSDRIPSQIEGMDQRIDFFLIKLKKSNYDHKVEILREENSEVYHLLLDRVFPSEIVRTKRTLIRVFGRLKPKDPKIHWRLFNIFLSEQSRNVRKDAIHTLGEINPEDPEIPKLMAHIIMNCHKWRQKIPKLRIS